MDFVSKSRQIDVRGLGVTKQVGGLDELYSFVNRRIDRISTEIDDVEMNVNRKLEDQGIN